LETVEFIVMTHSIKGFRSLVRATGLAVALYSGTSLCAVAAPEIPAPGVAVTVDGQAISQAEFDFYLAQTARQRYYHGKTPDGQDGDLRQQVIDGLVMARLLAAEADRQGVAGDAAEAERMLQHYRGNLANDGARATFDRETAPALKQRLLAGSKIKVLEARVREVRDPDAAALRAFYERHRDAFTEPERSHIALILVSLPPSATQLEWTEAGDKARAIHAQLKAGADFAEVARQRSGDQTASTGGDMGYVHKGMLAPTAEAALAAATPGSITEPLQLLEGWAIFKLIERAPARVHPLADQETAAKARELYLREAADEQWAAFTTRLRQSAKVTVNEALLSPAAGKSGR
jgi:peptidyl-prolyl cis-trans isomerase C